MVKTRNLFLLFCLLQSVFCIIPSSASAKSKGWDYEIASAGVARADGYYLLRVSANVDSKKDIGLDVLKKCAIHGVLFRGFTGARESEKPLVDSPQKEQQHASFFQNLLEQQYANYATSLDQNYQTIKTANGYRVTGVIQVAKDQLRSLLEQEGIVASVRSSVKKPLTIMVVPMDHWCQERGFWEAFEDQGSIKGRPDYERAVQDSRELMAVISKINTMLSDRGITLQHLSQAIKSNTRHAGRQMITTSRTSGAQLEKSSIDELNMQVKADIILYVDWEIIQVGPKHKVNYMLDAIDAYTDKQVAGIPQGTGMPSFSTDAGALIEEAVVANMDGFVSRLQNHFQDCVESGREITLEIGVFENSPTNLETEFGGDELSEIINDWVAENTVNHQFNTAESSETTMLFTGTRIPMSKENGTPLDARGFAQELRKHLRSKYQIESKVYDSKLGYAQLIIGEK